MTAALEQALAAAEALVPRMLDGSYLKDHTDALEHLGDNLDIGPVNTGIGDLFPSELYEDDDDEDDDEDEPVAEVWVQMGVYDAATLAKSVLADLRTCATPDTKFHIMRLRINSEAMRRADVTSVPSSIEAAYTEGFALAMEAFAVCFA